MDVCGGGCFEFGLSVLSSLGRRPATAGATVGLHHGNANFLDGDFGTGITSGCSVIQAKTSDMTVRSYPRFGDLLSGGWQVGPSDSHAF